MAYYENINDAKIQNLAISTMTDYTDLNYSFASLFKMENKYCYCSFLFGKRSWLIPIPCAVNSTMRTTSGTGSRGCEICGQE
jgi:hypothetical protein